ncbi:hypothetical protein [Phyllobacterium sp. K27]
MPDDQSEEPDLRSRLTLHAQRQHRKPANLPYFEFASAAGGFLLFLTAGLLAAPRSHFIR